VALRLSVPLWPLALYLRWGRTFSLSRQRIIVKRYAIDSGYSALLEFQRELKDYVYLYLMQLPYSVFSPLEFFHTEATGDSFAFRASEAKRVSVRIFRIRMVLAARATCN